METTQPSIFIGHGAPLQALEEDEYRIDLTNFASHNEDPNAIISVSAHWEKDIPIEITSNQHPDQIYDFWGFPSSLYELKYRPPGQLDLVNQVVKRLSSINLSIRKNSNRGIDHGTWVPLSIMYPKANIPTIQLSIPRNMPPQYLLRMGQALSEMRNEGVMFMGSGNVVHNLRRVRGLSPSIKFGKIDPWAKNFDEWLKNQLDNLEIADITNYVDNAPHAREAVPTTEHFFPLFFTLGTLLQGEVVEYISQEIYYQNISMRSFELVS